MEIIEVLVELDNGKESTAIARIEEKREDSYVVRYLSPTKKLHGDLKIYAYEKETYTIDNACVSGFYDSVDERDAGFVPVEGGWVLDEDSDDYEPSSGVETETESDVSLTETESESEVE
jgi:hypothetical protein